MEEALKLRKDVSKPGLLRGVVKFLMRSLRRLAGGSFPPATVGCRGAGGVSGAARLAVAAWSIDDTQAFGGGNESASSVRSGSGSLRHDPASSSLDPISPVRVRYRRAFQQVL